MNISGSIVGHVVVSAGSVSRGPLTLALKSDIGIKALQANNLAVSYVYKKHNVIYTFISSTENMDLPAEVITKQPNDEFGVLKGKEVALTKFEDIKVDGGVWKFQTWHKNENDKLVALSDNPIISNDDLVLVGEWVYVADEKTSEKPSIDKTKDRTKEVNKPVGKTKSVKTGDESNIMVYIITLLVVSVMVFSFRRRQN